MNIEQFELLIEEHGLHHIFTIASQLRFLVSLHVEQRFGTQYLHDTLAFGRDEFANMDEALAQLHINTCKSRMEHASQLKTPAWLYYPAYLEEQREKQRQAEGIVAYVPPKKRSTHAPALATTINYPAH